MLEYQMQTGNLVLFRGQPARIRSAGKRLEIELQNGETIRVRPKDITLLHSGPVRTWNSLVQQPGDIYTAWELLAGGTTSLQELAELSFGEFTVGTAWSTWQAVSEGLLFSGTPDEIVAHTPAEVERISAERSSRAAERQAWGELVARLQADRFEGRDRQLLKQVESLALGAVNSSRVLRAMNLSETQEAAHHLLLRIGYWTSNVNPHPARLELPARSPSFSLPSLPDEDRIDLTHMVTYAIDDKGCVDPDDAVGTADGLLWVHVADCAALIQPDDPVDLEARSRGATLYLPESTIPMLPPAAAARLGLGLGEVSPALSFRIELESDGSVSGVQILPSWVRVTRLAYSQADQLLDQGRLESLKRLTNTHSLLRHEQGAISISMPEVRVRVLGEQVLIEPIERSPSREMVTEAMLMAGHAVARYAATNQIPFAFVSQSLSETPLPTASPDDLAHLFALRRSLAPSKATTIPGRHAGLGLEPYTRITSPLRRYLDLVAHQQLRRHLRGEHLLSSQEVVERLGAVAALVRANRQAEWQSRVHWTLVHLSHLDEWIGDAVMVQRHHSRGRFLIPSLDLETDIHLRHDHLPGTRAVLELLAVDIPNLTAQFSLRSWILNGPDPAA